MGIDHGFRPMLRFIEQAWIARRMTLAVSGRSVEFIVCAGHVILDVNLSAAFRQAAAHLYCLHVGTSEQAAAGVVDTQ